MEKVESRDKEDKTGEIDSNTVNGDTPKNGVETETGRTKEMKNEEQPHQNESKDVPSNKLKSVQNNTYNDVTNSEPEKKNDHDMIEVEDSDDYLIYLEDILKKIHEKFYEEYDSMESGEIPDLKKVIPKVRGLVLKNFKLVFSGLVPTRTKLEHSKAYQVARSLGALVTQDLEDDTTHLVAVRPGTVKVNAGKKKKNLKIVTPDWLWSCAER